MEERLKTARAVGLLEIVSAGEVAVGVIPVLVSGLPSRGTDEQIVGYRVWYFCSGVFTGIGS
ncbi:hypothetical protein BWQ96_10161 [Gracilariopsis chorda]|uniref:Uncharacterized protein n=1 Tax=Gracilariopsis chorda TaxID=448386 RepID=A0A2V3IDG9_9FLOR|nr:hypothetical protein BWQ96_10161 [Gracilariopsis chorda]|eukprot:PXF40123.1 hypothetical protein BWQ96_10161 [Gracilariopsis chorda]